MIRIIGIYKISILNLPKNAYSLKKAGFNAGLFLFPFSGH
jgi:hypothetical protein